jgi:UDP-N-acetylglucosamine 2-epimerase (non-hydrolysing)
MRRVMICVGTRPELIKMAGVICALRARDDAQIRLVITGQHQELLTQALADLQIQPDEQLQLERAQGGDLSALLTQLLGALDAAITRWRPDLLVGHGDTSTCFASALTAFYRQLPFAHVEAGLRMVGSGDAFPEEAHRRAIAPLATLHLAPTWRAQRALIQEGVPASRIFVTGNTGVDRVLATLAQPPAPLPAGVAPDRSLVLITMHRRESLMTGLPALCEALRHEAPRRADCAQFIWPLHPNPQIQRLVHDSLRDVPGVLLLPALPYPAMISALTRARLVMTDSGGLQEEAAVVGVPAIVLREGTERFEGVERGASKLAGVRCDTIRAALIHALDAEQPWIVHDVGARCPYGDGRAVERVVQAIMEGRCEPFYPLNNDQT